MSGAGRNAAMKGSLLCLWMAAGALLRPAGALELTLAGQVLDVHGFVSQGYLKSSEGVQFFAQSGDDDGSFEFTEYGINVGMDLGDAVRVGAQVYGRNLGDLGDYEPTLDWAFVDYRFRDWLGVRAGRIKVAHGLYNEYRDYDMLRPQIFLPQSVYFESMRDAFNTLSYGASLYGNQTFGKLGKFHYQAQLGAVDPADHGGAARYIESVFDMRVDGLDNDWAYGASVQWETPMEGLRLGYSFFSMNLKTESVTQPSGLWGLFGLEPGTQADMDEIVRANVFSAEYTWGELILVAEYMIVPLDYTINNDYAGVLLAGKPDIEGYYASASYRFADWFQLALTYSEYYPSRKDKDGASEIVMGHPPWNAWLKDLGLTARFDVMENWIVKLEIHRMDGGAVIFAEDQKDAQGNYANPEEWTLFMAKIGYSF
jgi:hypothetical protein